MANFAVVKTGGKQYLVKNDDQIVVDRISGKDGVELETLAVFSEDGSTFELGTPSLSKKIKAQIVSNVRGAKVRVARFKSKVRFRKVRGFRADLTKLKVTV